MPTILLQGAIAVSRLSMMRAHAPEGWEVTYWSPADHDPADFPALAAAAEVIVGGAPPVPWPNMDLPKLKLFQIPWTGFDFTAPDRMPAGIPVANCFEHETAIAEFVLLSMLEWEIKLRKLDADFRREGWGGYPTGQGPSHGEIMGKTLGVLGWGHIAQETVQRARAFGMRCIAVRRSAADCPPELDCLGQTADLDRMLAESDYVLVACDMNAETRGLIDADRLAAMKPDGVIINVARGSIIEEDALFDALSERRIGGAVIDTWWSYGDGAWPCNRAFQDLDNVILSAHRSALTEAMHDRRWGFVSANAARAVAGEPVQNIVFTGIGGADHAGPASGIG
ncbi:MAG: 2-hydroxyacid dehydrogenase [Pseudomonadota bacterium]